MVIILFSSANVYNALNHNVKKEKVKEKKLIAGQQFCTVKNALLNFNDFYASIYFYTVGLLKFCCFDLFFLM